MSSTTAGNAGPAPALRRVVTRWQLVGLALNDVVGSGVYLLPAAAAAMLGTASLWAVLVAGMAVLLLVLCFAEAACYFEEPGGAYLYAERAFGHLAGFEVGWMTWLARVASEASLSAGLAQAMIYLWPAAATGWGRAAAIVIPTLALMTVNIIGVRFGAGAAVLLSIGKLAPLVILIIVALPAMEWTAVLPVRLPGTPRLTEAALLLLYAYAGFENTPAAAGEYRNPRKDVAFALVVQIVIVTSIYFLIQLIALGTHPNLAGSTTPLADCATRLLGGAGGLLLTIGAVVSILGTNSNSVLHGPRYLLALARDGYGPKWFSSVHPRYRTPANAILFQTLLALPLALTGSFVALAELSVVARMVSYLSTALALRRLRRAFPEHRPALRLPGGAQIPAAAVVVCVGLLASATRTNLIAGAVAAAAGLLVYRLRRAPA